jgi:hypothetical protein
MCLALAATGAAVVPMPASAQAPLPPSEITTSVRSMGLQPISAPVLRGERYVLRAIDRRGAEVRVAADALNGRVLFVRPIGYAERPIEGRVYTDRVYPRIPQEAVPPQPRSYEQTGKYERPPDRPPGRIPGNPAVIYAPRDTASSQSANPQGANPQPPAHAPSAAKPMPTPAPKVAAKPPAQTAPAAAPAQAPKTEQPAEMTTGTISSPPAAADKPPTPKVAAKPPAQSAPAAAPVQAPKTEPSSEVTTGATASPPATKPPASQPPASQVAATPLPPAAPAVEAAKTQPPPDATTGSTSSPPAAEKNPALTAPPVQAFD